MSYERGAMPPYVHAPAAATPGHPVDATTALVGRIDAHEERSQHRFEVLRECFESLKEKNMSEDLGRNVDNVRVNVGRGGFDSGYGWGCSPGGYGGGLAAAVGAAIGAALFRRFGFGDGDGGAAVNQLTDDMLLSKLGNIEGQIGISTGQIQNGLLQQTLALNGSLSGVKDAVTNSGFMNLQATNGVAQAVQSVGCSIKEAVRGDGEATRALISAQFQAQQSEKINALAAEVIELRNEGRMQKQTHDINLNVTNLQNQISNQAQANTQVTLDRLATGLAALTSQVSRQSEVIFNSGTMAASGNQRLSQTNVG